MPGWKSLNFFGRIGLSGWISVFVGIVAMRAAGDLWVMHAPILDMDGLAFFIHSFLYFSVGAVGFFLLLHFLTAAEPSRLAPFVLFLCCLFVLPPLFDFLLTAGAGGVSSYRDLPPVRGFWDFAKYLFDFVLYSPVGLLFSPSSALPNDIRFNLGVRIETNIMLFVLMLFVFRRTKSILRMLWGLLLFYGGLFTLSVLPGLCAYLFGRGFLFRPLSHLNPTLSGPNAGMSLILGLILGVLGLLLFIASHSRKFLIWFAAMRPARLGLSALSFLIGAEIAYLFYPHPWAAMDGLVFFAALLAVVLRWMWAVARNDLVDEKADSFSSPERPLVKGSLARGELFRSGTLLFWLSLASAWVGGFYFFVLFLVPMFLAWTYSEPPLRLKRIPLLSNLVMAACHVLTILSGFALLAGSFELLPVRFSLAVTVCVALIIEFKNIKDRVADQRFGVATMLTLFGPQLGPKIVGFMGLGAALITAVLFRTGWAWAFSALFGLAYYFAVTRFPYRESLVLAVIFGFAALIGLGLAQGLLLL